MKSSQRLEELIAEFNRQIDVLYAEYKAKFVPNASTVPGAGYGRLSGRDQKSIPDQVREILNESLRRNVYIRREHIYFDVGISGRSSRRTGLNSIIAAMESGVVTTVIFFSTSRMFRKNYKALEFAEKYTQEYDIHLIYLANGFDSKSPEAEKLLAVAALLDQFSGTANVDNIRAVHVGLFLAGFVVMKLNYGFVGVPVGDQLTRRGLPRCRIALQADHAEIVKIIFAKFLYEFRNRQALVRWLNKHSGYAPPKSAGSGQWTITVLNKILTNKEYLGYFTYQDHDYVYMSGKNYSRKKRREKPLAERWDESLRIISDELFEKVQQLILQHSRGGKRGPKSDSRIHCILSGRVYCPTHRKPLYCCGKSGGVMSCRACDKLEQEDRPLFSYLPRAYAGKTLIKAVFDKVESVSTGLIPYIVAECKLAVEGLQSIDPQRIKKLEGRLESLAVSVKNTYDDPGTTLEDKAIAKNSRNEFRIEMAKHREELAKIKAVEAASAKLPSSEEVARLLKELSSRLQAAYESNDLTKIGLVNELLDRLIGDRIDLYQCGEAKSHRGWLECRCPFLLKALLLREFGVLSNASGVPDELVIDFRRPRKREALKQKIHDLYQVGQTEKEIAAVLEIGDSTVERYLNEIHRETGATRPTKSERRKVISKRESKKPFFKQIAGNTLELILLGVMRGEIAKRLQTNRTTLEKTVNFLREQGHHIPDGRSTNSGYKNRKTIPLDIQPEKHEKEKREAS